MIYFLVVPYEKIYKDEVKTAATMADIVADLARRLQLPSSTDAVTVTRVAVESSRVLGIGVGLFIIILLAIFQCGSCILAPQLFRSNKTQMYVLMLQQPATGISIWPCLRAAPAPLPQFGCLLLLGGLLG